MPASTRASSRSASTLRATPRSRWRSSKRVTPRKTLRSTSGVHHSPTSSRERAIEQLKEAKLVRRVPPDRRRQGSQGVATSRPARLPLRARPVRPALRAPLRGRPRHGRHAPEPRSDGGMVPAGLPPVPGHPLQPRRRSRVSRVSQAEGSTAPASAGSASCSIVGMRRRRQAPPSSAFSSASSDFDSISTTKLNSTNLLSLSSGFGKLLKLVVKVVLPVVVVVNDRWMTGK